jgi:hypothetical protein
LIGIPDLNPNHDLSALGSENRLKAEHNGDPLGVKFRHVMQILANGPINPKLSEFLEKNPVKAIATTLEQAPTSTETNLSHLAPTLSFTPSGSNNEVPE